MSRRRYGRGAIRRLRRSAASGCESTVKGSPLLLINGLGANVDDVDPAAGAARRVRGHHLRRARDGPVRQLRACPYTISRIAEVARQVLDDIGHERADVLGYSLGGAVAQQLAFQRAGARAAVGAGEQFVRCRRDPWLAPGAAGGQTPARHYTKSGYDVTMQDGQPRAGREGERCRPRPEWRNWHHEALPSLLGYMLQMTAFSTFNSLPWLHRVSQPTWCCPGTEDRLMPMANSAVLAAYLPNARLSVFERWGHYLLHDAASGAGATVADFLGRRGPRGQRGVEGRPDRRPSRHGRTSSGLRRGARTRPA